MKRLSAILLLASVLPMSCPALRAAAASENWTQYCATCHGENGAGQTKMGRRTGAKDLTDADYQKTFTDDQLFKNLKAGETGPDGKVKMKPYGDQLSDGDIRALVGFVRSLAKANPGQKT